MFQDGHDKDLAVKIRKPLGVQLVGKYEGDMFDSLAQHLLTLEEARTKFNSGIGAGPMSEARNKVGRDYPELSMEEPEFDACLLAAVMMHCGATIKLEDRQWLKSIYRNIPELSKATVCR